MGWSDYIIPIWGGIYTIYLIAFTDMTLIESFFIGLAVTGIGIIIGVLIKVYLYPRLNDGRERKKLHRKRLVDEVLKRELQNMNITYKMQEHKVLITDLEELEKRDKYRYTIQHLKRYQPILISLNKSKELVTNMNNNIGELIKYIFNKIETELDDRYKKALSHSIYHIVKEAIKNDYEDLSIKTRNGKNDMDISLSGQTWACVKLKNISKTKIKKFLNELERDIEYQKLINIRQNYKELNKEFDNFKLELSNLLDDIKGREEDLKGKCDKCSFWADC